MNAPRPRPRATYTAQEEHELQRRLARGDATPSCPRCGATCAVVRAEPRRDVAYVRDRVVARCPSCGGTVATESAARRVATAVRPPVGTASLLVGAAVLLAASAVPLAAAGQSSVGGTVPAPCREGEPCGRATPDPGPVVLELAAGARSVALGGAFWTSGAEAGAIFHHPSLMSGSGFGTSWQRFHDPESIGDGVDFLTMSGSAEWLGGVAGVGLAFLQYNTSREALWAWPRDASNLGGHGRTAASAYVATGGFAREVGGFALGAAVKAVGLRVGTTRGVAAALDLGASREVGPAVVALTVQNLGPDLAMGPAAPRVPVAPRVTLGAGAGRTPVGPLDVGGTVRVVRTGAGEVLAGGGVEVAWWPLVRRVFIARVGLLRVPGDMFGSSYEFTFGGGFAGDRIRLDYAYQRHGTLEDYPPLAVSHTFGLAFR